LPGLFLIPGRAFSSGSARPGDGRPGEPPVAPDGGKVRIKEGGAGPGSESVGHTPLL
jgi:hypothetical protein